MMDITIASEYKFSELQIAAEAFILDKDGSLLSGTQLLDALVTGNGHNSKLTETEANDFLAHWRVVEQQGNTGTGFSGTLFECILDNPSIGAVLGEKVMSFRSTEFVDDDIRDGVETNAFEIAQTGWAWGQMRDMEAWYAKLTAAPDSAGNGAGPLYQKSFSVTGYSLGGHLATAFNLLHPDAAQEVVTFNGAGVGQTTEGDVPAAALALFTRMSQGDGSAIGAAFDDPVVASIYRMIRAGLAQADNPWTIQQAQAYLVEQQRSNGDQLNDNPLVVKNFRYLTMALSNIRRAIRWRREVSLLIR